MAAPKAPKAPKMPKKPKAPKVDAKKAGGKLAKKAGAQRKKLIKKLLIVLIALVVLGIIALIYWLTLGSMPTPTETVDKAISAALIEDDEVFRTLFTPDSVDALESAWSGADFGSGNQRGSWNVMMRGILTEDGLKPKVVEEKLGEDGKTAEVLVDIDGVKRTIHLDLVEVEDEEHWLINVNLGIDPNLIVLPEEQMTEAMVEEFEFADPENEMWWEDREAAKAAEEAKKKGGCLGCVVAPASEPLSLPFGAAFFGFGLLWLGLRARRRKL